MGGGALTADASAAGLASESPEQIVKAVSTAVRGAKGFEMQFVMHKPSGSLRGEIIRTANGGFEMHASLKKGQSIGLILLGRRAYFRASTSFWMAQGVGKGFAKVLSPKWYKYPIAKAKSLQKSLGNLSPTTLSQCVASGTTPLTKVGTGSVNGQPVVILKSAGGKPGTGPGVISIATHGPAYPLRIVETGPTLPGGPVNGCNDGKGDKTTGTLNISHWDSPPAITAPAGAISLPTSS